MSKISGQFLISGQFQDIREISGISGQLGALHTPSGACQTRRRSKMEQVITQGTLKSQHKKTYLQ